MTFRTIINDQFEEDEMSRAYSTHEREEDTYKTLVGKPEII
jgi:hypothetical protein